MTEREDGKAIQDGRLWRMVQLDAFTDRLFSGSAAATLELDRCQRAPRFSMTQLSIGRGERQLPPLLSDPSFEELNCSNGDLSHVQAHPQAMPLASPPMRSRHARA